MVVYEITEERLFVDTCYNEFYCAQPRKGYDPIFKNITIELLEYDQQGEPLNPYNCLTDGERQQKIVEMFTQLYLKWMESKNDQK